MLGWNSKVLFILVPLEGYLDITEDTKRTTLFKLSGPSIETTLSATQLLRSVIESKGMKPTASGVNLPMQDPAVLHPK
jgi:hypothetical protein